jgi:hypothetical protein
LDPGPSLAHRHRGDHAWTEKQHLTSYRGGSEAFAAWSDEPIARHSRVVVVDALSARSVLVTPSPV